MATFFYFKHISAITFVIFYLCLHYRVRAGRGWNLPQRNATLHHNCSVVNCFLLPFLVKHDSTHHPQLFSRSTCAQEGGFGHTWSPSTVIKKTDRLHSYREVNACCCQSKIFTDSKYTYIYIYILGRVDKETRRFPREHSLKG